MTETRQPRDMSADEGRVSAVVTGIGIALCFTTGTMTMWGGMPIVALTGLPIVDLVRSWTLAVQVSLSLVLFAALLVRRTPAPLAQKLTALAGGALVGLGCALLWFHASQSALVVSGTAIGLGQGALLLLWLLRLECLDERTIARLPLLSLAASAILYLIISRLPNGGICLATVGVAALSALLLLVPINRNASSAATAVEPSVVFDSGPIMRELSSPIFCIASIAAVVLLTRFVALGSVDDPNLVNISANVCILVISLGVYIVRFGFGVGESQSGSQGILVVYYALFPVIATALLLLLLGGAGFATLVAAVAYAGFAVATAAVMTTSIAIARNRHARPEQVYGVLLGSLYLALTAVTALCDLWLFRLDASGDRSIAIVSVTVLYVLAISLFVIHRGFRRGENDSVRESAQGVAYATKGKSADRVSAQRPDSTRDALTASMPATVKPSTDPYSAVDEIERRCVALGKQHGLTDREQDIMALIVRGRDAPGIARQLHISINTVRTHSKNLYRKLDIHSKQELLDLLEQ